MVVGFLIPMAADIWALARLVRRLRRLVAARQTGEIVTPDALRGAFSRTRLEHYGTAYAAGLWHRSDAVEAAAFGPVWRSPADPEQLLQPAGRIREAASGLAGQFCLVLLALGFLSLLYHAAISHSQAAASAPASPAALDLVSSALGLALYASVRLLQWVRSQQLAEVAGSTRRLFPTASTELLVERWTEALGTASRHHAAALGDARDGIVAGLAAATEELKTMLAGHDRRIAASVASSVQRAIQPIGKSIQEMLARLEAEDASAMQRLLQGVLTDFLGEFQQRFGAHAAALGDILVTTRALAEELQTAIGRSEQQLSEHAVQLTERVLSALAEAIAQASAQQTAAMTVVLQEVQSGLAATTARMAALGEQAGTAVEQWTDHAREAASGLIADGAVELKRIAAAFNQLHAILETLSLSVLPAVNRLVSTQERLQVAIEADRETAEAIAAAASDLGEAVRIARDMIERQVRLTRDLAQLAHQARPESVMAPAEPAAAPSNLSDRLARAIDDLRAETEDERRSLPQL